MSSNDQTIADDHLYVGCNQAKNLQEKDLEAIEAQLRAIIIATRPGSLSDCEVVPLEPLA